MDLRDYILSSKDLPTHSVNVPEWNCDVLLKLWSGQDRAAVMQLTEECKKKPHLNGEFNARLIIMSVVDDMGNCVFTTKDLPELQKKSGIVLDRLAQEAVAYNGVTKQAAEDAEKNLPTT